MKYDLIKYLKHFIRVIKVRIMVTHDGVIITEIIINIYQNLKVIKYNYYKFVVQKN